MLKFFNRNKRRVVLCVAIPYKYHQFEEWCNRKTDFYKQLVEHYGTNDDAKLWNYFKHTAFLVKRCIWRLRALGVRVIDECNLRDIVSMTSHDLIILIAHKQSIPEAIELWDDVVLPSDFALAIPEDFKGAIDMACCNSVDVLNILRHRCHGHSPFVARDSSVPINLHVSLLPLIIRQYFKQSDKEYIELFRDIYEQAAIRQVEKEKAVQPVMLGKRNDMSTLYAPKSVLAGDNFEVQLYFHRPQDSDVVEIFAKGKDSDAVKIDTKSLKMKLANGDNIKAKLRLENNENNDFNVIGSDSKSTKWDLVVDSIDFRINVHNDCSKRRCECKLLTFVNRKKVGEILFNVEIIKEGLQPDKSPVSFDNVRNQDDIKMEAAAELRRLLQERLLMKSTSDTEKNVINRCLRLLNTKDSIQTGRKNVFVSSTGDMKEYRMAARDGIISLEKNLNPILYENWVTEPIRPCDKCSEKVMESDYFILILGARYGHIEEEFGLSMTLIEYLVAVFSGKPILAFLKKNINDTEESIDDNQVKFLKRVRSNQLVSEFETEDGLKYQVKDALREIIPSK